jgi:hypothetical protein
VIAADFQHPAGEAAIRQVCGVAVARLLHARRVRWIGVVVGRGGTFVLPYETEAEFLQLGAHALDIAPYLPGPTVLLPFGGPELRRKLIAAARVREFEMAEVEGHA